MGIHQRGVLGDDRSGRSGNEEEMDVKVFDIPFVK
jgi:hypothetical protein